MRIFWGNPNSFPAVLFILLQSAAAVAATPPSVHGIASKNLDTMNAIEMGRLAGMSEAPVPVRVGKELNERLKEKYLQELQLKLKDEPELFEKEKSEVQAEDFLLDSKQLLETLEANPDFEVNLSEKMELMAALRLANQEGRAGRELSPSRNLRQLIIQELSDAIDNKVPSLRLSGGVTKALAGILSSLPEDVKKRAESALKEEEIPVKTLKEIFDDKASESLDFDTLRDALAELRTDHSLAAGVRFSDSFARDRREDLIFRNSAEKFQKILDGLLNANQAAKNGPVADSEPTPEKGSFPDGFSKVPTQAPKDEPFGGPHPEKTPRADNEREPGAATSVASPGEGLFAPQGPVRGFNVGTIDPGVRSSVVPSGNSGDGAANIAGAQPASGQDKKAAEAAIAAKNAEGIFDFSVDIFSDYGDAIGKCQMTILSKVFDSVARVCRIKAGTADHCVKKQASSMEIAQLGASFPVQHISTPYEAEHTRNQIMIQRGAYTGMDIAAVSLNLQAEACPSDTVLPVFELASRAPRAGDTVIVDGHQTLLGGVKKSPEGNGLLEVNLSGNTVGIYEGNSGGGTFIVENGKIKFAGPLSAKFTSAKFNDRLGLVAADSPAQAWFRQQLGQDEPQLADGTDLDNSFASTNETPAHDGGGASVSTRSRF
ncbi:MAG: hypothetical protein KDD51_12575 [Bdellovibrionales bacterium]|nr:hypothetical protein [Bdellovibrionales bacterium]